MNHSASRFVVSLAAAVTLCAAAPILVPSVALAQRGSPSQRVGIGAPKSKSAEPAKPGHDAPAEPAIAPGTGSIIGIVVDSLHGDDPLRGASVVVHGLPARHAVTTDAGAFRIDSIPPGRYVLELIHPVLDSIGIRVLSDTIPVAAGAAQTVQLAVPGARTLANALCPPALRRFGPGIIAGRVFDAVTSQPAVGTEVSVAWTETQVGTDIGVRSVPHLRKATVGPDGAYRICGVPASFNGSLQAIRGAARTAEVPLDLGEEDRGFATRVMYLPPPAVAGAQDSTGDVTHVKRPTAVITGKVTNAGGVPVSDARVSVQGAVTSTSTGKDGTFTLAGVPPGTQSVLVRRVGYTPVELPMDVSMHAPNKLTVRLGVYTPQLSSVQVKAKAADPLEATGFSKRKKGGMGKYIDLDQIEQIRPSYTTDVLRRISGLYVTGSGYSANVVTTRGNGCVRFIVDNNPVNASAGQTIDELVSPQDVAAVEFYQTSEIPLELSSGQTNGCALVVIWTKGQLKDPNKSSR